MTSGDLIYLLQKAIEARRIEREAFSEYGGYSWGYHGRSLIDAANTAEHEFGKGLESFVKDLVLAATKA